ncbi:MAG: DoxX family protein [Bacteroidia bacterium]
MSKITKTGKWLFVIPFAIFGLLHFGPLEFSLPYVPRWMPFPAFWVYFTGALLFAFAISASIGKFDKLASLLLTILMLVFVFTIHIPKAISGDFIGVIGMTRDACMAGAGIIYGAFIAKDNRFTKSIF